MTSITPEAVKAAKFQMTAHLNGGRKFSQLQYNNAEWGLLSQTSTDGSPEYRITSKTLTDPVSEAELDLTVATDSESRLQEFCDKYNAARDEKGPK